jgi:hypothetical protein
LKIRLGGTATSTMNTHTEAESLQNQTRNRVEVKAAVIRKVYWERKEGIQLHRPMRSLQHFEVIT